MTKKEFFEKYFPFIYREEGQTFRKDMDKLVEDEIYAYCHEDKLIKKEGNSQTLVCCVCGGSNIQTKMWVDTNSNTVLDACSDGERENNWCEDCEEHVRFCTKDGYEKSEREIQTKP